MKDRQALIFIPPRSKTTQNMSDVPSQAESWTATLHQPNQVEGAIGAGPQQ